jgi:hypothetical protein
MVSLELELAPVIPALPPLGALRVECPVPAWSLEIDGRPSSERSQIHLLRAGQHDLTFRRPGYVVSARKVTIHPDTTTSVSCGLRIDTATLSMLGATLELPLSNPELALTVDGLRQARVARVPYGEHVISISKGARTLFSGSVRLAPNEHRVLDVPRDTRGESGKRPAPVLGYALLGTGVATAAVAVGIGVSNHDRHETWQTEQDSINAAWESGTSSPGALEERQKENDALYSKGQLWDRVLVGTAVASSACLAIGTALVFGWLDADDD